MPVDGIHPASGHDPEAHRVPPLPEPARSKPGPGADALSQAARMQAVLSVLDDLLAHPAMGGPNIERGTASAEATPLRGLVYPDISFESVTLQRARAGRPDVLQVAPGEVRTAQVPEGSSKTVFAHPLEGGGALGIVSLFPNGLRSVTLAHVPASGKALPDVAAEIDAHHAPEGGPAMRVVVTLVPEGSGESAAATGRMMQSVQARLPGVHTHALGYRPGEAQGDADMLTLYVGAQSSAVAMYQGVQNGACTMERASAGT